MIKLKEVSLTNLDKVYWKEENYTKGDLIQYYTQIAPYILPYLKNRPMVLRRHPQGIEDSGFFQKNTEDLHLPEWIQTVTIQHEDRSVRYLIVQNKATLLYVANLGCIEMNPFNSTVKHLHNPDYLILDLDPEEIDFDYVIETAQVIHDILEQIGIKSYCKTSGKRGIHIFVPLGAKYEYEQVKRFAEVIALMTHQKLPDTTSVVRQPAKRQKKVYVDFLQNNFGQTLAAPYSVRPKPGAPVSTPLKWSEVKPGLDPRQYNMHTILDRIEKVGDLFKPVLGRGCDLQKSLRSLEKS